MKATFKFRAIWPAAILIFVLLLSQYGCDGSSSTVSPTARNSYRVEGVLVNDMNAGLETTDTSLAAIILERNNSALGTAQISIGTQILVFDKPSFVHDSVYSFAGNSTQLLSSGAYPLGIVDTALFGDTLTVILPDTFRVNFYTGDSTVPNTNGQEIQISWTAAANVEGYVVAVVLEDSAYTGYGWSQYVTSQATETTIPPDAYRLTTDPNGVQLLETGWYNIYIYGYAGHPDSLLSAPLLPVPLPSQLGDNIDETLLEGKFGSVVVTKRVRSEVVSE